MPCVGLFSLLRVLRSYVVALVLFGMGSCLSLRSCSLVTWLLLPRVRALPRSPGDRSCRGVLEPPSPRSLFTHACLVPMCCWSASTSCFVIMLALTPASSTPAPCPRSLFATLVTSRRRVHERRRREALASQGLPVRRLHQGTPCHSAHCHSRSVQSSFGNTSSPGKKALFAAFTTSASPHLHIRSHSLAIHSALRSFTLQQCNCKYMTISVGYVCDRRLQIQ